MFVYIAMVWEQYLIKVLATEVLLLTSSSHMDVLVRRKTYDATG